MDPIVAALAKAAGLDKAIAEFPADIEAAAAQAMGHAEGVRYPTDPAAESTRGLLRPSGDCKTSHGRC